MVYKVQYYMVTRSLGLCCTGYQAVHRCGGDVKLTTKPVHAIAPTQFSHTITLKVPPSQHHHVQSTVMTNLSSKGEVPYSIPYMDMDDDTRDYMHMCMCMCMCMHMYYCTA